MLYTLKSGVLYRESAKDALISIQCSPVGPARRIYKDGADLLLKTDIHFIDAEKAHTGDLHNKEYTLTDPDGNLVGTARPEYAEGEDPDEAGWPVYRMPGVDRAVITIGQAEYLLRMHDSRDYALTDSFGEELLHIRHKGISGGWQIECDGRFAPELLCGLFVFCRYIEQENEFLIV